MDRHARGKRKTTWLLSDSCVSLEIGLSDSVSRVGFDGEEDRRTGQRLLLKEGATNSPVGPEDPCGTSLETRAYVLPSCDGPCQPPRGPGAQMVLPPWPSGMEETLDLEPQA